MNRPDAVNHWDLPVLGKPRHTMVRIMGVVARGSEAEPDVELLLLVRRAPAVAFDFYRGRVDRADAIRRYA